MKNDLNYILCIVTRYFGGIKLGAGGLIRAYRKATLEAINKANINELIDGYEIILEVDYSKQKDLEYLIKNNYQKEYQEKVKYIIQCNEEIKNIIVNKYEIQSIKKIKITKNNEF